MKCSLKMSDRSLVLMLYCMQATAAHMHSHTHTKRPTERGRERFNDSGTRRRTHTKCIIIYVVRRLYGSRFGELGAAAEASSLVHIMHQCTISHEIYVALHRFSSEIRMHKQNEVCKFHGNKHTHTSSRPKCIPN